MASVAPLHYMAGMLLIQGVVHCHAAARGLCWDCHVSGTCCSVLGLDNIPPLGDVDAVQELPDVLVAHMALVVDERCAL